VRLLARIWFRLAGWKYVGRAPTSKKLIVIGSPHTSNWDFVLFLAVTSHFGINAKVIGKHTLTDGPFGWLMRRLGVIPVKRDSSQGVVEQMVHEFDSHDHMALVLAPEGTRGAEPYWRSGFYRIALAAGAPVVTATVDSRIKTVYLHDELELTGDVKADMDRIRDQVADGVGIKPGGGSTVRLRDEELA